jgi:predicted small lipoprotein YifL
MIGIGRQLLGPELWGQEKQMKIYNSNLATLVCASILAMTAMGCKEKGPLEQAGEEVDEAVRTVKNGGKETTADKLDDAADDVRHDIKDAEKDLKKK